MKVISIKQDALGVEIRSESLVIKLNGVQTSELKVGDDILLFNHSQGYVRFILKDVKESIYSQCDSITVRLA